jgi:hypothetical protein
MDGWRGRVRSVGGCRRDTGRYVDLALVAMTLEVMHPHERDEEP